MNTISGHSPSAAPLSPAASDPRTAIQLTSSFAEQLAVMLQQLVGSPKAGSHFEIDVTPAGSQNSDTRQFMIKVTPAAASPTPAASAAPAPTVAPATPAVPATPAAPQGPLLTPDGYPVALLLYGASGGDGVAPPPPPAPKMTSHDAYWALQPEAVQQLRNVDDLGQREALAVKLKAEGYTLDYPIMVWGWDPLSAMRARQAMGLTWVPSFAQPPLLSIPGVNHPGIPPYDPSHPPAGSILVSTDFARGTLDDPALNRTS